MRKLAAVASMSLLVVTSTAIAPRELVKWTAFTAPSMQFNGKHVEVAAILIPVRIEPLGISGWLQFDTGVNVSSLYEGTLRRIGHAVATPPATVHIAAAGFDADVTPSLDRDLDEGDILGRPVLGTLGIDALRGRALALDFPHHRLAVAPSITLLPRDAQPQTQQPMHVVTGSGQGARLQVAVCVGNVAAKVAYDTGSSPFVLVLSNAMWHRVTGRALGDSRNFSIRIPSFGEKLPLIGARAHGVVSAGVPLVRDPIVYTGGDAATEARFSNGTDGTLGNAPFAANYVVVLDFGTGRFGLRKVTPAHGNSVAHPSTSSG
ncbi:MAG TPA: hypothetical protein VGC72_12715 [Candidatus Elarobacter sp.]